MSEPIVSPVVEYATMRPDRNPDASASLIRPGVRLGSDFALALLARSAAVTVLLMLVALVGVLLYSAWPSIHTYGASFLTGTVWRPNVLSGDPVRDAKGNLVTDEDGNTVLQEIPPIFGALPVIYGTAISSVLALVFAVPLSFGAALFLIRIAPRVIAGPVSFLVEFLAAIPSIAYGLWGLFVLAPFLQKHVESWCASAYERLGRPGILHWMFQETLHLTNGTTQVRDMSMTGRDLLCGGLVLAIMIVPIITAISRDILKAVPRAQVEGTVALGATWWQSSKEMLRYSRAGLFGAVMLGLARAAGETMAVTMVIGNNNQIRASLFAPAQTMSSLLANEFAEASGEIQRSALCEVALILLVMSLAFNVVARSLVVGKSSRSAAGH